MAVYTTKFDALSIYGKVSTLLDASVHSIINNLPLCTDRLENLPGNLKDRCLHLMSKRGLITDSNIQKILHENLKVLDLSECEITDEGIRHIKTCPQLVKIDLNSAKISRTEITSQGIVELAKSCPHLQTVYLRRCLKITDEAIIALSTNCPQLHLLNLGGCERLTDRSLHSLGQNSQNLKCVNFAKTNITDEGVLGLLSGPGAARLQQVHLDGCVHITDESVEAVLHYCPNISILLFHGCPKITEKSREALENMTAERHKPMKQVTWTVY